MWNREESRTAKSNAAQQPAAPAAPDRRPHEAQEPRVPAVGSLVFIKGELTSSEDLTVDGRVEGRISLPDHSLTIGPNAHVHADLVAKVVTLFGFVVGAVTARDRADIRRGASLEGELSCARIAIQDGAHFRGKVVMGPRRAKANGADAEASSALVAVG